MAATIENLRAAKGEVLTPADFEAYTDGKVDLGGAINLLLLEQIMGGKLSDHYNGRPEFPEVVVWGDHLSKHVKSKTTPPEERWKSAADIPAHLQGRVKFLSFEHPEITAVLEEITDLAEFIKVAKEQGATALMNHFKEEYQTRVDKVMAYQIEAFKQNLTPNTVAVTLLRGGARFEKDFVVDDNRRVRVDAKRLDFGEQVGVGFAEWEGLEAIQSDMASGSLPTVDLAFVDDCGATLASIRSAVALWRKKAAEGLLPPIRKVYVYVMVGAQPGVIDLFETMDEIGQDTELISGEKAFQLSNLGYIERAEGEVRQDGKPFTPGQAFVGDMGDNTTIEEEVIAEGDESDV